MLPRLRELASGDFLEQSSVSSAAELKTRPGRPGRAYARPRERAFRPTLLWHDATLLRICDSKSAYGKWRSLRHVACSLSQPGCRRCAPAAHWGGMAWLVSYQTRRTKGCLVKENLARKAEVNESVAIGRALTDFISRSPRSTSGAKTSGSTSTLAWCGRPTAQLRCDPRKSASSRSSSKGVDGLCPQARCWLGSTARYQKKTPDFASRRWSATRGDAWETDSPNASAQPAASV
jgi:hypothetical protein